MWTARLRDCYLDYHTNIHAVGLACPGVDYIRLWPLPVLQPWWNLTDKPAPRPGWYAWGLDPARRVGVFLIRVKPRRESC